MSSILLVSADERVSIQEAEYMSPDFYLPVSDEPVFALDPRLPLHPRFRNRKFRCWSELSERALIYEEMG